MPSPLGRLFFMLLPTFLVWGVTCFAELNRTPFDFAEGESELVSGFNVEYGSVKFAIIFIAEYCIIYFFRILTATLFFCEVFPDSHSVVTGVFLIGGVI